MEDSEKTAIEVIEATIESPKRERRYPTKHNKHSLTESQQVFADCLASGKNATDAVRIAYGDEVRYPSQFGHVLREKPQIQRYLMETAQECAEIQMRMIMNERTPAAVRMDGIKDRLNRAGIGKEEDDKDDKSFSIGDIHINVVK